MATNLADSMKQSAEDFQNYVLPILKELYYGRIFKQVENTDKDISEYLDIYAGIDILMIHPKEKSIIGIASRIQRGFCWNTFTVRCGRESGSMTEFKKRTVNMKNEGLFPALTLQAYVEPHDKKLLGMAIIRTVELWEYIEKENPPIKQTGLDQYGQASFYVVSWNGLRRKNYPITIVTPRGDGFIAKRHDIEKPINNPYPQRF